MAATTTAAHILDALGQLLFHARSRKLTAEENSELQSLCEALDEGIPCRPIYNRSARDFGEKLRTLDLAHNAEQVDGLLKEVESLRRLAG